MKKLQEIAKALASLSKQVEKLSKQVGKSKPKAKPKKKAAVKKTAAKKAPTRKKAVAKKARARKTAAPRKAKANVKQPTVLEKVLTVIQRSKKGANIATLRSKTGLDAKQLSNALYKLSKKGVIGTTSRGVYVKK